MAINTRIVNGSHTEIYVGRGNFITQAASTNFHRFWSSKILAADESADLFVEVTAARRAQLEQSDAAWVRAPQCFIDLWNATAGEYGCYNEATGFFELNGITDIPYAEAVEILALYPMCSSNVNKVNLFYGTGVRTLFPIPIKAWVVQSLDGLLIGAKNLEKVVLDTNNSAIKEMNMAFHNCRALREIDGIIQVDGSVNGQLFTACTSLEDVRLYRVAKSISIRDCAKLSRASVACIVANARNTSAITITLHPDTYARVTNDIFAAAAAKNITIAST